ncbi:hypothetical protein CDAR_597081 [Caerostris darwini]|uniref:Uncharacterized protein n=1 Tax=Caerostris darwini TaxID=1538125 RepID=A0AAV4U2H2_9ARAC|nr:hypothetical protein CDAR_597081 [Caerostris darwini]
MEAPPHLPALISPPGGGGGGGIIKENWIDGESGGLHRPCPSESGQLRRKVNVSNLCMHNELSNLKNRDQINPTSRPEVDKYKHSTKFRDSLLLTNAFSASGKEQTQSNMGRERCSRHVRFKLRCPLALVGFCLEQLAARSQRPAS